MTKHTPGPWLLDDNETVVYVRLEGGQEPAICGTDGSDIAPLPDSQCIANARLIAAAPEMLEALKHAESACSSIVGPDEWPRKEIRAAIR
jgi:hypothetical protein